jgi:NTP pyrophosphatase (non-canonical NTP hydrolase)
MWISIPDQSKVITRYGADAQAMVHMEECAELIQAASKMRRVTNAREDDTAARFNLLEETADVLICIKQMQEMYGFTDHEIQQMVDKKCKRQEARL